MAKYIGLEVKGVYVTGWFEQHICDVLVRGYDDYEFIQLDGDVREMWRKVWRKIRIFIAENGVFSEMESWTDFDDFLLLDDDFEDMEELTDEDFMI